MKLKAGISASFVHQVRHICASSTATGWPAKAAAFRTHHTRSTAAASVVAMAAAADNVTASAAVPLATPVSVGSLQLQHRVAMSAMTRLRMDPATEAATDLTAEYYAQRSSPGGLLISECLAITDGGRGYVRAGSLITPAQAAGWKKVTAAVHAKGGFIFAQLFHAGRVSHDSLVGEGNAVVAPSAVVANGTVHTRQGKQPYSVPKALEAAEMKQIVQDFAAAAARAVACGFDGIELHAGNGYLLHQFMAAKTNTRSDEYGGSVENRMRFLLEVVDAAVGAVGASKVGVKLQPGVVFTDLVEPEDDVRRQLEYLAAPLAARGLAFVDLSSCNGEPYFRFVGLDAPNLSYDPFKLFRAAGYTGTLMVNGGLSIEAGTQYVLEQVADVVAFGGLFLANPTLPALVAAGWGMDKLNPGGFDTKTWYGRDPADDAKGYTDWPLITPAAS